MLDFTCQNETAWRCRHDLCTGVRCRGDGHGPGDDLCGEAPLGEGPCSCGGRPGERGTGSSPHMEEPASQRASIVKVGRRQWQNVCLKLPPKTKKGTWTRCAMHRAALMPSIHQIPEYPTGEECRIWAWAASRDGDGEGGWRREWRASARPVSIDAEHCPQRRTASARSRTCRDKASERCTIYRKQMVVFFSHL